MWEYPLKVNWPYNKDGVINRGSYSIFCRFPQLLFYQTDIIPSICLCQNFHHRRGGNGRLLLGMIVYILVKLVLLSYVLA